MYGYPFFFFSFSNFLSYACIKSSSVQAVVIDEVDAFLFRPHLGLRAKYHGVCPNHFYC